MPILRKLKSLLGVGGGEDDAERDVTVTVEHDPENEAAVKGTDVEDSTSTQASDESTVTDEGDESAATGSDESAATGSDESPATESDESPDEVEISDAEASTEDSAQTDAEGASGADGSSAIEPVDVLDGIGSAYARRLGDAGIDSVGDLADANAAELSEATDIAQGRIEGWIDQAEEF